MPSEPLKRSFLYKDGKAEIFDDTEVEAKLADGWYDNPATSLDVKPKKKRERVDPDDVGDGTDVNANEDDGGDANEPRIDMDVTFGPEVKRGPGRPRKNAV